MFDVVQCGRSADTPNRLDDEPDFSRTHQENHVKFIDELPERDDSYQNHYQMQSQTFQPVSPKGTGESFSQLIKDSHQGKYDTQGYCPVRSTKLQKQRTASEGACSIIENYLLDKCPPVYNSNMISSIQDSRSMSSKGNKTLSQEPKFNRKARRKSSKNSMKSKNTSRTHSRSRSRSNMQNNNQQ